MLITIILLFVANSILHSVSYLKLKQAKASNATGVLVFVFINVIIAFLLWQVMYWAKWLALIFTALGALGLLFTTIFKGKGTWIDYLILILDVVIVVLTIKYLI